MAEAMAMLHFATERSHHNRSAAAMTVHRMAAAMMANANEAELMAVMSTGAKAAAMTMGITTTIDLRQITEARPDAAVSVGCDASANVGINIIWIGRIAGVGRLDPRMERPGMESRIASGTLVVTVHDGCLGERGLHAPDPDAFFNRVVRAALRPLLIPRRHLVRTDNRRTRERAKQDGRKRNFVHESNSRKPDLLPRDYPSRPGPCCVFAEIA